ncbi:glycine cleavage system aminomethyltransferase GcvT [Yunchengibacter salinarum]|uniref:glycine cleavage system aminomethyltransferase GcvT n=1 Tax=Yunchengibacter salinarum TaxID=3133399 RepID=UPI0035B59316
MSDQTENLKHTPLTPLHMARGARMVPFAGYSMPLQYEGGIIAEHTHCRNHAGLFDVSHMGQATVRATDGGDPAAALEEITPGFLTGLKPGKMRYTLLLNDRGGIVDDLMVTRLLDPEGSLYIVVNAACKEQDYDRIEAALGDRVALEPHDDHALLALQGPEAEDVLAAIAPDVRDLGFMQGTMMTLEGVVCWLSRSGYTGEDGFEISIPADEAPDFAQRLLRDDRVALIGLGARDSLRLEAGLCLSGHDFNADMDPVEAGLAFAVSKKRRGSGGFAGADRILSALDKGPARVRVGLTLDGRRPAREGDSVLDESGEAVGVVTSGGYAPSLGHPIAMAVVPHGLSAPGTAVSVSVRGKPLPATVTTMPFREAGYKRQG